MRRFMAGLVVGSLVTMFGSTFTAHPAAQNATLPPIFVVGGEVRRGNPPVAAENTILEVRGEWLKFTTGLPTAVPEVWVHASTGMMWFRHELGPTKP